MRVLDMLVRILQLRLLWQTYHWRGQRRTDRYDRYYLGTFRDMQLCMDLQDSNDFVFECADGSVILVFFVRTFQAS